MIGYLARYMNRMVAVRFAVVLFAVGGFAVVLDLLDVGTRVVRRLDGDATTLAWYALQRLPSLVTDLVPLTALVASLLATLDLVRHRELVIAWAAGVSRAGIALRLLPVAILIALLKLAIDDQAVPATVPVLRGLGVIEVGRGQGAGDEHLWLRHDHDIVRLPRGIAEGSPVQDDILVFRRDAEGRLTELVRARRLLVEDAGWRLLDVTSQAAGSRQPERDQERMLPIDVPMSRLQLLAQPARELGVLDLARTVASDGFGIAGTEAHRAWLHGRLATATSTGLLVLLGIALTPRYRRGPVALGLLARGLAIGLTATLFQGIGLAVAEDGLIPAWLAAWTVPACLALLIAWLVSDGRRRRAVPVAA